MKKCPFCGEEIRDEAIKCRFCGEFLEKDSSSFTEKSVEPIEEIQTKVKREGHSSIRIFFLFLILSFLLSFIILVFQPKNTFPYLSMIVSFAGIAGIVFSIRLFRKKRRTSTKLLAFSIPLFLLGILYFNINLDEYKSYQSQQKQAKLAQQRMEEERQRTIQYNIEHKEEHYQKGLEFLKEKKYQEAKDMFAKVNSVDESYKAVKEQISNIDSILAKIEKEREIAEVKEKIIEAAKLLKSNNCYDIQQAINKCNLALNILPDSKTAKNYLHQAKLKYLRCYEGNDEIEMSVQITSYRPLKLYVWIKNVSNVVRHANLNYFTLVTVTGRSYSVATETYGLSNYFDAVELQPGTETSGAIIFDTWDKPKKLVYSETFGSPISREFPFD